MTRARLMVAMSVIVTGVIAVYCLAGCRVPVSLTTGGSPLPPLCSAEPAHVVVCHNIIADNLENCAMCSTVSGTPIVDCVSYHANVLCVSGCFDPSCRQSPIGLGHRVRDGGTD